MESLFQSVAFLRALQKPDKKILPKSIELSMNDQRFAADRYEGEVTTKGTILFVHGMTPYGYRDPRMQDLGRAAAMCGYRAVIPNFPRIQQGLIETASIEEIIKVIQCVTDDYDLAPSGTVGIFTASFSGSICIRAIAQDSVRDRVKALLIIGGCNNPSACFGDILREPSRDRYAKLILVKNFAKAVVEADIVLGRALSCAIEDAYQNGHKSNAYENYVAHLSHGERDRVTQFIRPIFKQGVLQVAHYDREIKGLHEAFMRWSNVSNIAARVVLVHSVSDNVISPAESQALFKELQSHGVDARLVITPLLDHANFKFRPKYIIDLCRLLKAFNDFFLVL
ncbi:MAG: hypothetical protein COW05_00090 [Gammaproteobacteria bacterium CG12_big_fil_rev_8_21_14_0_65_46_12]|nr:MAG: hypothetical protein COW05_00090 [Gammaproteobacteria bacterium CG12_big_fil_rev_8_21_14_0_65_46_12]